MKFLFFQWEKKNTSLHCLGFILSPFYYDLIYVNSNASQCVPCDAPNIDENSFQCSSRKIGEDEIERKICVYNWLNKRSLGSLLLR